MFLAIIMVLLPLYTLAIAGICNLGSYLQDIFMLEQVLEMEENLYTLWRLEILTCSSEREYFSDFSELIFMEEQMVFVVFDVVAAWICSVVCLGLVLVF